MNKKTLYETEIIECAEGFFSLAKDDTDVSSLRQTARDKLLIALWNYYKEVQYTKYEETGERTFERYSDVISITIAYCLKSYKQGDKSNFLHYVNAAVKKEILREQYNNSLHGIKFPKKTKQLWNKLRHLAYSKQIPLDDRKKMRQLGNILGESETEIDAALNFGKFRVHPDTVQCDGEEKSLFDFCTSDMLTPEKNLESRTDIAQRIAQFKCIDKVFSQKQKRVKEYVSALLTCKFYPALSLLFKTNGKKEDFAFVDEQLYAELEEKEAAGEELFTQQEIARRFGKDKTDASRTLGNFTTELKKYTGTK